MPTFSYHVVNILCLRAKKKMIRITTGTEVTFMKHLKAIRNRAIGQFIGKPVSTIILAIKTEVAISRRLSVFASRPNPASFCFINISPKVSNRVAVLAPITIANLAPMFFRHALALTAVAEDKSMRLSIREKGSPLAAATLTKTLGNGRMRGHRKHLLSVLCGQAARDSLAALL